MNNVSLVGRLTKEVELFDYTAKNNNGQQTDNKQWGRFTLAVNRDYKNANGERVTDFINCTIFNRAKFLADYTSKGSPIAIVGHLQNNNYQDPKTGQQVYSFNVIVQNFDFLETKAQTEQRKSQQVQSNPQQAQPAPQAPQQGVAPGQGNYQQPASNQPMNQAAPQNNYQQPQQQQPAQPVQEPKWVPQQPQQQQQPVQKQPQNQSNMTDPFSQISDDDLPF